jgi:hypothetical protein
VSAAGAVADTGLEGTGFAAGPELEALPPGLEGGEGEASWAPGFCPEAPEGAAAPAGEESGG